MSASILSDKQFLGVAVVGAIGIYFAATKAKDLVKKVAETTDPFNENSVFAAAPSWVADLTKSNTFSDSFREGLHGIFNSEPISEWDGKPAPKVIGYNGDIPIVGN